MNINKTKLFSITLLLSLSPLLSSSAQDILAGWHNFDADGTSHTEGADIVSTGLNATLQTSNLGTATGTGLQSNDRVAGGSGPTLDTTTINSGIKANASNDSKTVTFTIVNNSGSSYDLDHFYYDYKKTSNNSGSSGSTDWGDIDLIAVSGITGATDGSVLNSRDIGTQNFTWRDIDVSLSGYSIGIAATAVFSLVLEYDGTTASGDPLWHKSATYDNVALTGTAVPEPQSYALIFGFLVFSWVMIRARKN